MECVICIYVWPRGGVGGEEGERMRGLGLSFTNHV